MRVSAQTDRALRAGSSDEAHFAWRVGQFQPAWRTAVATVAGTHPALADLAESYPALLFAFASGYGTPASASAAMQAIVAGAALQEVADAYGLAGWTRKLPASVFRAPLPVFPCDADFARHMANLVPDSASLAAPWLTAVSEAVPTGGRQYALWIARHAGALDGALSPAQRVALHAWVWMSWHPGTTGHALVRRPWSNDLGIKRVMEEFGCFLARAALVDALGEGRLGGMVDDLIVHGLAFRPLRSAFDYIAAAARLDNCLEQYGERLRRGTTVVAAIFDDGEMIGCVEMGPHPTESAMPAIVQLRIARNRRAPAKVWSAAYAWLAAAEMRPLLPQSLTPSPDEKRRVRDDLWGPFLADIAASAGGAAFHRRARAVFEGEPPALDAPALLRRPFLRPAAGWGFDRDEAVAAQQTLLERLAYLAGRGGGRRLNR